MTEILYMKDINGNYIREFDAVVIKNKDDYVCLDKSAFYPEGGGQPSDTGFLEWEGNRSVVKLVVKKGDAIKHIIDGVKPAEGMRVHAVIDWDKRYGHMRMHTAQHILSGIVFDDYNARTVGNQIYADHSRIDFHPVNFTDEDIKTIENKFNDIVSRNIPVKIYEEARESLEKRVDQQRCNLDLLPKFISRLRIIEVEGLDICPCAGTHVKNTSEIKAMKITKKDSKGENRVRITYTLL